MLSALFGMFSWAWLLAFALSSSNSWAQQVQCVTRHDHQTTGGGWFFSPNPASCGPQCQNIQNKQCRMNCIPTAPADSSFGENLNPGMLVEQRAGKLLVRAVIPASPAARAGIQKGDEITSINGIAPGTSCKLTTWSSRESAGRSVVTIQRPGVTEKLELALLPIQELARRLWTGSEPREVLGDLFSFGMTWNVGVNEIQITGLLQGGAAARSGLVLGDRIVSIDSQPANSALISLLPRDRRQMIKLGVIRDGKTREISVEPASLIESLSAFANDAPETSVTLPIIASTNPVE